MQFELSGERTRFVVVAAETSDMAGGNFFDVEERITGQDNLKARCGKRFRAELRVLKPRRVWCRGVAWIRRQGRSEVCQGAHMKSFSLFYRRVYVVLGSLDEHRCSRITVTGARLMFI